MNSLEFGSGRGSPRASPIDVLTARAEARAYLWAVGELDMVDAVDVLEEYARRAGLIREIGQDAVQAIIAGAFEAFHREICDA
jgi:hypothetical protein